ncbi:Alpha-scruin [Eumeta japonica]|uniref:Alpha-scruin n=1 Tax=Eumeta variegata TaxID=151549 RepID=A0A4C1VVV7_EUMVA|nr:Alpha-scruin [Eumeta japonica]
MEGEGTDIEGGGDDVGQSGVMDEDKTTSSVTSIDVWEWKERRWKPLAELAVARHGHALAYLGTQLIIIGGVTTIYMQALSNVESYCCERSAWIRGVASLPTPLSGHGAVTLPPASLM